MYPLPTTHAPESTITHNTNNQGKTALNFLYAKPPGMAEAEAAQQVAAGGDDEAVKEFYRKCVLVVVRLSCLFCVWE